MRRLRLAALFAASALSFGTAFVGIKAGLATIPPLLFAALRFDLAAAILLVYTVLRYDRWRPRTRSDVVGVFVAGTFLLWFNGALLFVGQQYVTTAAAAVIYGILPVVTPLFALAILDDEHISPLGFVGIVVGFVGVAIIVRPDPANLLAGNTFGQALVLGATFSVAAGSVLLRRVRPSLDSLPLTAWAMVVAVVGNHATSLAFGEPLTVEWTAGAVLAFVYVGTVSTAFAFPVYFALIREVGAIRANLVSYVVPVVATVTGALVLDERLVATTALGFLVIVVGFVLLEFETIRTDVDRLLGRTSDAHSGADGDAETERAVCESPARPDGGDDE